MPMFGTGIDSYIAKASGDLNSAATWYLASTLNANDLFNQTSYYQVTTTYAKTTTFNGDGSTVTGLLLWIHEPLTPSTQPNDRTVTVALDQSNTTVANSEVTVILADLPASGPVLFLFDAPITLTNAVAYSIKVKASHANVVRLGGSGSGLPAITRLFTTATTGYPKDISGQNDNIYIPVVVTNSSVSAFTINWNATTSDIGFNSFAAAGAVINCEGATSTNYIFKIANRVRAHGTIFNFGTALLPLPATTTMRVEFVSVVSWQMRANTIFNFYATETKTQWSLLLEDVTAGTSSIRVSDLTGWEVGQKVVLTSTRLANNDAYLDERTITGIAGNTITLNSPLSNDHITTGLVACYVANLTLKSILTSNNNLTSANYIASDINLKNILVDSIGFTLDSASAFSNTGNVFFDKCTFINNPTIIRPTTTTETGYTIQNCLFYNFSRLLASSGRNLNPSLINNCLLIKSTDVSNPAINILAEGNAAVSNLILVNLKPAISVTVTAPILFENIQFHGFNNYGFSLNAASSGSISQPITIKNSKSSCVGTTISVASKIGQGGLTLENCQFYTSTGSGPIQLLADLIGKNKAINCAFTGAFLITSYSSGARIAMMDFINCIGDMGQINYVEGSSYTEINLIGGSFPQLSRLNQTVGSPVGVVPQLGYVTCDTDTEVSYNIYGLSVMQKGDMLRYVRQITTPITCKGFMDVYVGIGETPTVSVKVQKSVYEIGVSALFNGDQPVLMLLANNRLGVSEDMELATASAANGVWETLSATLPAPTRAGVYTLAIKLSGSGKNGGMYLKEPSSSQSGKDPKTFTYWKNGFLQMPVGIGGGGGGGSGLPIFIERRRP